ncbi:MAG: amino acid adenylation domain-containing protein [Bacillota bacterium]|nr:amino acid adenylation domain-containing protein [Bacillota bacterium]MDD3298557.1 amino acid adenylation domain-containing protein [Bacillota bacterium]MDD4706755.1 amino acid adenylation domain-containing protein [Bacillota bacterium]
MQYNVLEYLERTVQEFPDKIAYANESTGITFREVYNQARAIGTFLSKKGVYKQPVVVFMNKCPEAVAAFFGVVYGGDFYVPIEEEMPRFRIQLILNNLNPRAIICDQASKKVMDTFHFGGEVYIYDEMVVTSIDEDALGRIRETAIDTDPIYVIYTSGSTGIPKGVVACHRSVIDYIESLSEVLGVDQNTVFGNQTPFCFDASLKELYSTIKAGATTYIIPKNLFMFPVKLVEFLNRYQINTVCWVVPALTMISALGTLDKTKPECLRTIAFGSEVFPIKQFNLWRRALPDAQFINLYGPTEATGMCCYFKVDRPFEEGEVLPIGRPFKNTEIILLDQNNRVPARGELGEICVRGTSLTLGYYKAFDKTYEVFVQNPLNNAYPENIYRTGDLGRYNDRGELVFVSRKDHQIKHMGHRVELGEIEVNVNMIEGIKSACCVYDEEGKKIVLFFVGEASEKEVAATLRERLPRYMLPNRIEVLEVMPLTTNGKIDRKSLKEQINAKKKEK